MAISPQYISRAIGLTYTLKTYADIINLLNVGIPKSNFDKGIDYLLSNTGRKSEFKNFIVTKSSYTRSTVFKKAVAERFLRYLRMKQRALEVFEDEDFASEFLYKKHPYLNGQAPMEAAQTEIGADAVHEILNRAEHGLPS